MATSARYRHRPEVHARIIAAAMKGSLLSYSELGTSRAVVGGALFRITHEEDAAGRPHLTAIVVHKAGGRPGAGFLQAMHEVGYARDGESEEVVWRRAVADVLSYWRPKLNEDRDSWRRFQGGTP